MKRKDYTLPALALCFGLACLFNLPACYNSKPVNNDENRCPYELGECPNVQAIQRDYQIKWKGDSVFIYNMDELAGVYVDSLGQFPLARVLHDYTR